jgi:tetratricopeptide (TPR) repeat protein
MALPIIFIACDLSFKPAFFAPMEAEIALALSVVGIISLIPYSIGLLEYVKPRSVLMGLIEDIRLQFEKAGREGPVEPAALQRPVLRSDAGMGLTSLLDKLCRMGDFEPVIRALEEMKRPALAPQKSARSMALASSMVSMMAETAGIAARYEGHEVVYRALDGLSDVVISSPHQGTSSLAFRSMGSVFNVCSTGMGERELSRLVTKMIESYTAVYDRAGRHEALELAAAMAEKAADTRMFATEEYDGVLYVSGGVYRRLAEAGDSEEYANKSLTALFEALTARTAEASPIDHACIKGEIGRAYMALAKAKNPVKSYRSAAQAFEDAGRMLDVKVSPWDSALYRGKAACAYTFLADEFCRGKRYDDAIQAARSAIALYPETVKFFEKRSPTDYVEALSNMGFAHTIVSEVYLKSRMFDLSLKHATHALDAYSKVTKAVDPVEVPERYAFMKTIMGLTHVNMAEIHFREKRYESAISSCDSAIAAYNEAIRIYDDKGKDKPASAARKHLKKANDLFSTMMRIGVADKKPLAPVAEQ